MIKKFNEFIKENHNPDYDYVDPDVSIGSIIDVFDGESGQLIKLTVDDTEEETDASGDHFTNVDASSEDGRFAYVLWDNDNMRWKIEEWFD